MITSITAVRWSVLLLCVLFAGLSGCKRADQARTGLPYPATARIDHVDTYHGVSVSDPYRWLEDLDSDDTRAWITAQNKLTMPYLEALPARNRFREQISALVDYERFGLPASRSGVYVYTYNSGTQEQNTIWVTDNLAERGRVLLDANQLRADGTLSIGRYTLSPDGKKLAYSLSDGGSDWKTWRIRMTDSGEDYPEALEGLKFSSVSWSRDSNSFYYSRYPGDSASGYDDSKQVSIYRHELGAGQIEDQHIYSVPDHPTRNPYPFVTEDGRYFVIKLMDGFRTNGMYYREITDGEPAGETVRFLDYWDARYRLLGNKGSIFYFSTTNAASSKRIIAMDLNDPAMEQWKTIVPERSASIEMASMVGDFLIVQYIVDATSKVEVFDLSGQSVRQVSLPGKGKTSGFRGALSTNETFFRYSDYSTPPSVYHMDTGTGEVDIWQRSATGIDPSVYVTEQVFYASKDGTRVPMFIVRKKDVEADGQQPTILYGYGGFNISLQPGYSSAVMAWLEAGGIYAVANLRGGGEYGDAWHEAGTRLQKQNVFDDFIAAAEWLILNNYTNPERLAILGRSNGGLLVGAVANQRPDLFAAALPGVGVMDMLRYHIPSANARAWSSDYGLSENEEEFKALNAYSPYHNIVAGTCYPATLVLADANDDRVSSWHSYKYAAALQQAQGCDNPVLIRIEVQSGHGAGASTSKSVTEDADTWAFAAQVLGMELPLVVATHSEQHQQIDKNIVNADE